MDFDWHPLKNKSLHIKSATTRFEKEVIFVIRKEVKFIKLNKIMDNKVFEIKKKAWHL